MIILDAVLPPVCTQLFFHEVVNNLHYFSLQQHVLSHCIPLFVGRLCDLYPHRWAVAIIWQFLHLFVFLTPVRGVLSLCSESNSIMRTPVTRVRAVAARAY